MNGTTDGSAGSGAHASAAGRVRRLDERLGLALSRVALSGRSLVTYARDHVTVRTPSRPDFRDGNTLDLERPPEAGDLDRWIDRYDRTIAALGVQHVQLRWESGLAPDADPMPPVPAPDLAAACAERSLVLEATTTLLLDEPVEPPATRARIVAVAAPTSDPDAPTDRRWYAATVLYRYEHGERPDEWREVDDAFTTWSVDVQRELAMAERLQLWIAMHHGGPVGRLMVVHDRQGLAVVEDVIVHPAQRRRGVAAALTHRAVASHLDDHPGHRIGIAAEPGSSAERIYRRLGFRPHATVWTARSVATPGHHPGQR